MVSDILEHSFVTAAYVMIVGFLELSEKRNEGIIVPVCALQLTALPKHSYRKQDNFISFVVKTFLYLN